MPCEFSYVCPAAMKTSSTEEDIWPWRRDSGYLRHPDKYFSRKCPRPKFCRLPSYFQANQKHSFYHLIICACTLEAYAVRSFQVVHRPLALGLSRAEELEKLGLCLMDHSIQQASPPAQTLNRLRWNLLHLLWKQHLGFILLRFSWGQDPAKDFMHWDHVLSKEVEYGLPAWHCIQTWGMGGCSAEGAPSWKLLRALTPLRMKGNSRNPWQN